MKRLLGVLVALCLILAMVPAAVAVTPFTDVPATEWFYEDVENAYQMGLINGKTETTFAPRDNLTYAEAVKLAACMHQRYTTGSVTLSNGNPWYQSYVDYCKGAGIISKDYNWEQNATRAGYMEIFANALPADALPEINTVEADSIPDVPSAHPQAAAIYKLYRAGILQGNDDAHNCNPSASIMRSEVAAILTRMMDATERITFTMGEPSADVDDATETKPEDTQDDPTEEEADKPKEEDADKPKDEEEDYPISGGDDSDDGDDELDTSLITYGTNDTPIL